MYVFGGEGRSGMLHDVWVLRRNGRRHERDRAVELEPARDQRNTSGGALAAPMVHDFQFDQLLVFAAT